MEENRNKKRILAERTPSRSVGYKTAEENYDLMKMGHQNLDCSL